MIYLRDEFDGVLKDNEIWRADFENAKHKSWMTCGVYMLFVDIAKQNKKKSKPQWLEEPLVLSTFVAVF